MADKAKTTSWSEIRARRPSVAASEAGADEARITAFRELVYQLRHDAGLTQARWQAPSPISAGTSPARRNTTVGSLGSPSAQHEGMR
jgi:hypothetical protein